MNTGHLQFYLLGKHPVTFTMSANLHAGTLFYPLGIYPVTFTALPLAVRGA